MRFLLHNLTGELVELPLTCAFDAGAGVALPLELVFGIPEQPALQLAFEAENPEFLRPPAYASDAEAVGGMLRLAPHGTLGTEIDLQPLHTGLRYTGLHRVIWRPLDGRFGEAVVDLRIEPRKQALLVTDYGKLTFDLCYDEAPLNVESFLELAGSGFYDGKTFHKIVTGMAIQGGCPLGNGRGKRPDGKLIPAEFNATPFVAGTLAMARKGDDPDSASCQFFIALDRLPELDGKYTVIGQARDEESMRTLKQLGEIPTNRNYLPLSPVLIRSINLNPIDATRSTRLELGGTQSGDVTADSEPDR